ncbi:MAG: ribbon-helix-helix protein, CopG family [Gammaproteobacteria bacterium]|nr:ribbon-helix-helix protein, CopG family [Gammaproteobacteria bacterium]
MATRTVRLGREGETTLADLRDRTGLSISEVIRQALRTLAAELDREATSRPYDVFRKIPLPRSGGYALAPSSRAKQAVVLVIRRRHAS